MSNDAVLAVRSFFRALTLRVGVFSDSFLGRGRPLAQARLLFEIGKAGADIKDLRTRLELDSGYLSRLLRAVEADGLVEVNALDEDLRSRRATLTAAGRRELLQLNRLGDRFAEDTLEPLTENERERLVKAMTDVERLLNLSFTRIALEDPDSADAKWCISQFFTELGERFEHGFNASATIPASGAELRPPRGAFLIARLDGHPVGCGALKQVSPGVGSIKRMWISPDVRGVGIGRRMLHALEEQAVKLGMHSVQLETNRALNEALALYRRNGYREVRAFNDEPHAHHWFEKSLNGAA